MYLHTLRPERAKVKNIKFCDFAFAHSGRFY